MTSTRIQDRKQHAIATLDRLADTRPGAATVTVNLAQLEAVLGGLIRSDELVDTLMVKLINLEARTGVTA